jgi:hypothetical protein
MKSRCWWLLNISYRGSPKASSMTRVRGVGIYNKLLNTRVENNSWACNWMNLNWNCTFRHFKSNDSASGVTMGGKMRHEKASQQRLAEAPNQLRAWNHELLPKHHMAWPVSWKLERWTHRRHLKALLFHVVIFVPASKYLNMIKQYNKSFITWHTKIVLSTIYRMGTLPSRLNSQRLKF